MEGRTEITESIAYKNIPIDFKFTFKKMNGVDFLVPDSREERLGFQQNLSEVE
jgi:hypothetical protein